MVKDDLIQSHTTLNISHKLHIDLNEKLVDFGSVLVGAIDGYAGLLVSCFSITIKNCVDVFNMYR
jgi:hypothetical protein